MSKQDRQGVRTATDLERKYKFGQSFAETMGIATDARDAALAAQNAINNLDDSLNSTEIFNRLTENGTLQGLYKEDGDLYINAKYIGNVDELFAKNINMTGKFTTVAEVFLEPGSQEIERIRELITASDTTSDTTLYDFNDDGVVDALDLALAIQAMLGNKSLSNWSKAVKSTVTVTIDISNPKKAISITGVNMWGRTVDVSYGVDNTYLSTGGGTMYGDINMNGSFISNIFQLTASSGAGYIGFPLEPFEHGYFKTLSCNTFTGCAPYDGNGNVIADTYLPLAGGTLTGGLWVDGTTISHSMGVKYTSLQSGDTGQLYLFAHTTAGRGLYDSIKGTVISVTDSGATFNGNATGWSSFSEGSGYMGFANNHKICWGSFSTGTYDTSTAAGYNYYGDVEVSVTFPSAFNGTPTLLLQPTGGTSYVVAVEPVTWSASGITKIRMHRANSSTNVAAATIRYLAIY